MYCIQEFHIRSNSLWVIDIDNEDLEKWPNVVDFIRAIIKNDCKSKYDEPIVYKMPTKSGFHLITRPFDKMKFNKRFEEIFKESAPTIKDNHLTLLYEDL